QPDRPDAGGAAGLAAGNLRLQAAGRGRRVHGDPRGRCRARGDQAEGPGPDHHRPPAQRAALRLPSQHHEGQEEADRAAQSGGARRRRGAAGQDPEGGRAGQAQVRRESEERQRAGRQTAQRSEGDLMAILLLAEHDNAAIKPATLNAVTAAGKIGGEVHLLVAGQNAKAAAEAGSKIAGIAKVLLCDDAAYANGLAENVAALLVKLAPAYSHVLAAAPAISKSAMPRAAALLDVAQISDIIGVESPDTFVRLTYAGNAVTTVQSSDKIKVITVRSTGFDAASASGGNAPIEV